MQEKYIEIYYIKLFEIFFHKKSNIVIYIFFNLFLTWVDIKHSLLFPHDGSQVPATIDLFS